MRPEVVHEEVVGVVDKEMQSIKHLLVVPNEWHLQVLVHNFLELGSGFILLMDKLDLSLLLRLFEQEVAVPHDLVRLFDNLVDF